MRIRRLQIKDFRRYRDLDIDFAPGLTVVRGPNEAGKTTIQRAIELAITRRATSGANDLNVLRPWDAPADARTIINLEFEQDEDDVTKTGTLEKVFGGAKGTVDLRYDGQSITDPTLSDQVIAELTGIPTEAFFRSTASVRHHELADIERDESALHDRLQASISGADRGTSRAKRKLERAIFELATKGDKNPGRLKVAEAALAQATASLEQGETALAQLERDRDTLAGARERRVESETALAERRSLLEKARQAERLTAEQTAAQERFERYREAAQVVATLTALADSHPSANPLPVLRKVVERLREVDTRIRELKAALAGEVEVTFEIPPEPTWRPLSRVGGHPGAGGPAGRRRHVHRPDLPVGRASRRSCSSSASAWPSSVRSSRPSPCGCAGATGFSSSSATSTSIAACAAAPTWSRSCARPRRTSPSSSRRSGWRTWQRPRTCLPARRRTSSRSASSRRSSRASSAPSRSDPCRRRAMPPPWTSNRRPTRSKRSGRSPRNPARANGSRSRCATRNRRSSAPATTRPTRAPASRPTAWTPSRWPRPPSGSQAATEELSALQRRERVYVATLEAIERAEQATMKSATRYLEQRMVRDVAAVTEGRYRRVRVDDKTLDIEVFAPERDDWVPVTALSQGTLDVVYLAARLGLVRLVTGDRRPPLVFDDPFVTLDDERARRALELLRRVADDFQVIYLTTSSRYDEAADAIVELPGPTAVDDHPLDDGTEPAAARAEGAPA